MVPGPRGCKVAAGQASPGSEACQAEGEESDQARNKPSAPVSFASCLRTGFREERQRRGPNHWHRVAIRRPDERVIEVTHLAANRIADLDRRKVPWKRFHEINFVNIDYKDFDASAWPALDSGLLGPVSLRIE